MSTRRGIGGWLDGPPRTETTAGHPGARWGLAESGPGALAPLWRRVVALFIDGVIAQVIAVGVLGYQYGVGGAQSFLPLLVVLVMNVVLVGTVGYTIGHRLLGLRVERCPHGYAGLVRGAVRSVLLCLAIPALIMDRDQRGLHDRIAGTIILRDR